jgi:predicted nucleotidyltransferase
MIERLATRRLSASDPDDAFLAEGVADAAADLVAALERAAGAPVELMLTGSLARGEGTVWRGEGGPVALSDIDFAAVLPDESAHARAARVAPALTRALARRLGERGLVGGVDVGVYTRQRLARQQRRPGTLEARRSAIVLRGEESLRASYPAFEEHAIPPDEALVLLENRGAELLLGRTTPATRCKRFTRGSRPSSTARSRSS